MRFEPIRAFPSRSAIVGSILILSIFVFIIAGSLIAMARIDDVYQSTERSIQSAIRSILQSKHDEVLENVNLHNLLMTLDRMERIAVGVDLKASTTSMTNLRKEYESGNLEGDKIVELFLGSFDELQKRIEEKRQSIATSFQALIVALAISLIVSVIIATSLSMRLNASTISAEWSRISLNRSIAAEEQLRKRIANDLHDDVAQEIAAARMLCERIVSGLAVGTVAAASALSEEAAGLLSTAGRRIRSLAFDLRPPELEQNGIEGALEALCARSRDASGNRASFNTIGTISRMEDETAIQVYRVVQEALVNARKHAGQQRVDVVMSQTCLEKVHGLMITVQNAPESSNPGIMPFHGGTGVMDSSISSGLGLTIMRERAILAGGTLSVEAEGHGFQVRLFLPESRVGGIRS